MFSMRSETATCSNIPERPKDTELAANQPVLLEIEHLEGKILDKEMDSVGSVLNRNADFFRNTKPT